MRGRAATAFWNVDGLVKFACAQDGAVLYFDEFAFDEEWQGLPDELVPLVDLVAVDLEDEEDHDDTVRPLPNTVAPGHVRDVRRCKGHAGRREGSATSGVRR